MPRKQAYLAACLLALLLAGCASRSTTIVKTADSQEAIAANSAKDAFHQGRFEDAAKGFTNAISLSQDPAATAKYKASLADVYREWALRTAYVKKDDTSFEDYMQAIRLSSMAIDVDPANRAKYEDMISKFQAKIEILKYRAVAKDEHLIPDGKPSYEKIEIFMEQARAYILAGDYVEARKHFEKVLKIDPSNAEAARGLEMLRAKTTSPL
jgi:tetratricopeptide (TPR) repeat protein